MVFFRLDHEYVARGYFFHKGRMKVMVSKIYRVRECVAGEKFKFSAVLECLHTLCEIKHIDVACNAL